MDIMELGAIGELVGGVAVIGSLIYVGIQVNHSNRLAQAQAWQNAARFSSDVNLQITRDDMELALRAASTPASLSDVDRGLLVLRFTALANYWETLFYARERGTVEDDLWKSRVQRMQNVFGLFLPLSRRSPT